jgi:phosphatidylserine/phosphatidylglycerophosphate/cardiolipin synthase-like enzyme
VRGPAVHHVNGLFSGTWLRVRGPSDRDDRHLSFLPHVLGGGMTPERVWRETTWLGMLTKRLGRPAQVIEHHLVKRSQARARKVQGPASAFTPAVVEVLATGEHLDRSAIVRAYHFAFRRSRKEILIANAYFIPNARLRRALAQAVRRGVEVKLAIPASPDVRSVFYATRHVVGRLLRSGVRVFEVKGRMLHAKIAVVDREWSTVGSANLDPRSRFHNAEANLGVTDRDLARAVASSIHRDLEDAQEILLERWQRRGFAQRLFERIAYAFRYWL